MALWERERGKRKSISQSINQSKKRNQFFWEMKPPPNPIRPIQNPKDEWIIQKCFLMDFSHSASSEAPSAAAAAASTTTTTTAARGHAQPANDSCQQRADCDRNMSCGGTVSPRVMQMSWWRHIRRCRCRRHARARAPAPAHPLPASFFPFHPPTTLHLFMCVIPSYLMRPGSCPASIISHLLPPSSSAVSIPLLSNLSFFLGLFKSITFVMGLRWRRVAANLPVKCWAILKGIDDEADWNMAPYSCHFKSETNDRNNRGSVGHDFPLPFITK